MAKMGFTQKALHSRKRAGIEDLRFHDLRHNFASRLAKKCDLVIVRELMGHASIVTTQRYLHSQAKEKLEAVETLTKKILTSKPQWQMSDKYPDCDAVSNSFLLS